MKKVYQQPVTIATEMEPASILCASMIVDPNPGDGNWGA